MKLRALILSTAFLLIILFVASICLAEDGKPLDSPKAKASYSLGYLFGKNLKSWAPDLDTDILFAAVRDGLEGKKPAMTQEEIQKTMKQLSREGRSGVDASKNKAEGEKFLAANKTKEGVKTLPSGLQYMVLGEGNGPRPQLSDTVKVNYRGTLLNGKEFDSSYERGTPEKVRVNGVIKGWTEALQLMKTGSKWRLFVPAELAYGGRQYGKIPPNSTLIFELELVSIEKDGNSTRTESAGAGESTGVVADKAKKIPSKESSDMKQ